MIKPHCRLGMASLAISLAGGLLMLWMVFVRGGTPYENEGWFVWLLISLPIAVLLGMAGLFGHHRRKLLAVAGTLAALLMCVAYVMLMLAILPVGR